MAKIKSSQNQSTELAFIKLLAKKSVRGWRRRYPLVGRPDFVFPKARIAVFIDGCFWHGCPQHCRMPTSNRASWELKISKNISRDKRVTRQLKQAGWSVIRFWEHDMKGGRAATTKMNKLKRLLEAGTVS